MKLLKSQCELIANIHEYKMTIKAMLNKMSIIAAIPIYFSFLITVLSKYNDTNNVTMSNGKFIQNSVKGYNWEYGRILPFSKMNQYELQYLAGIKCNEINMENNEKR